MSTTYEAPVCPFRSGPCEPYSQQCPLFWIDLAVRADDVGQCPKLSEADVDDFVTRVAKIESVASSLERRTDRIEIKVDDIHTVVTTLAAKGQGSHSTWIAISAIAGFVLSVLGLIGGVLGLVKPPHGG